MALHLRKWLLLSVGLMGVVLALPYGQAIDAVTGRINGYFFADLCAFLNGVTSVFLVMGGIAIRKNRTVIHRYSMRVAFATSVLFLLSYLVQHALVNETHYPKGAPFRSFYFFILISHIVFSAVTLPLVSYVFMLALKSKKELHQKWSRIAYPIWLYVSMTGLIVYVMISPFYSRA